MKRPLAILAVVCLMPLVGQAQDQDSSRPDTATGGLTVQTHPSGAVVEIRGPVTVTGISPTVFHHRLAGDYRLQIRKHLYQGQSMTVNLQPGKQQVIDVRLKPKTRERALVRSAFIPGWGQYYSEQDLKAGLFVTAAAGSVIAFFIANNDYNKKQDAFERLWHTRTPAQWQEAANDDKEELWQKNHDADHAYKVRRTLIGVVAGVWALNLADAIFFFPEIKPEVEVQGINVTPSANLGAVGITLSRRF